MYTGICTQVHCKSFIYMQVVLKQEVQFDGKIHYTIANQSLAQPKHNDMICTLQKKTTACESVTAVSVHCTRGESQSPTASCDISHITFIAIL